MDIWQAISQRRSCRHFLPDPVGEKDLKQILSAAAWAPSPLNSQPWEFIVITNAALKEKVFSEAERTRLWAMEVSGWKWLGKYQVDFLKNVPVLIAVVGNPAGTGVDALQEEGRVAYQHACAAAIQNMQLAAHALGLASLWFTLFDKKAMRAILGIAAEKTPLALVCLGKAAGEPALVPRKDVLERTTYIR